MTTVAATELKSNFKIYAGMAAEGIPILIKRPQKQKNLVLIDEDTYYREKRLLEYFSLICGYKNTEDAIDKNPTDSKYSSDFIALFGSISEDDLIRPEQGDFSNDIKREELI